MDIQEVCTRLGLKDVDELAGLLDFSDRSSLSILKKMGKKLPVSMAKKVVICADGINELIDGQESKESKIKALRRGWACILKGNTNSLIPLRSNISIDLPEYNPSKLNGQSFFHSGHILGDEFYPFLKNNQEVERIISGKYLYQKECLKNMNSNGIVQFSVANMQQTKKYATNFRYSQAFFENRIVDYLKEGGEIFYEAKVIHYLDSNDKPSKYPIGTQIIFKTLKQNNSNEDLETRLCNHVFIPNFDIDFEISGTYKSYYEFYQFGCTDKYKDCFKNIKNHKSGKDYDSAGNRMFYLVLKNSKNNISGIFPTLEKAQNILGDITNNKLSFDFNDLVENRELEADGIFRFTEIEHQKVFDYLKKQKAIRKSNNGNYFYPAGGCIFLSDRDVRDLRLSFDNGKETLISALEYI